MKAAFNIPPATTDTNLFHLLVEVGSYGLSLIWFNKDPFAVKGITSYNFTSDNIVEEIKEIMNLQNFKSDGFLSATICYDFKESILTPAKYYRERVSSQTLDLQFGNEPESGTSEDLITSARIYNSYRIPHHIASVCADWLPGANTFHSTSLQLECLNGEQDLLYCIIFHNAVKLVLMKDGKLQLVHYFNYLTPEDVTYNLVNVCAHHDISAADVQLRLTGMIDEQSRLYLELYKYFTHVGFDSVEEGISEPGGIKDLPAHFFSHLIALASCVS